MNIEFKKQPAKKHALTEQITPKQFDSLRVSLGSACDLACTYCVPEGDASNFKGSVEKALQPEKLAEMVLLLNDELNLKKIRITGGEPLLGNKLERFVKALNGVQLPSLTLTTNGQLLASKLDVLERAGITKINVSLDSLKPEVFKAITVRGKLEQTLDGIEQALQRGFSLKINMIPQRGVNDDEILDLLEFCAKRGVELRFIELMRMGHMREMTKFKSLFVSMDEITEMIGQKWAVEKLPRSCGSTSQPFKADGLGRLSGVDFSSFGETAQRDAGSTQFGVIANESQPFCHDCGRLRLSPKGELAGCLSSEKYFSLLPLLDQKTEESKAKSKLQLQKILSAAMAEKQPEFFTGSAMIMKEIGG
ncbi:MAG: GTP 3',8-cyclase MoaA [SAR324 cluster bacterium]|nr:GTP 3',8-cyclase MoaA [SAR324 cluster bacterium]